VLSKIIKVFKNTLNTKINHSALTKVLISVKTYPTLSTKYNELVCTAGFLEDGSWVRIYPWFYKKM
jgi:hypothetical protein